MSKFCKSCGNELMENTKFCTVCGAQAEIEESVPTQPILNSVEPAVQSNQSVAPKVTFGSAYKDFWTRYVDFSGRASIAEYWFAFLGNFIVIFALGALTTVLAMTRFWGIGLVLYILFALAIIIPSLAILVRRIRDTGLPPVMVLLILVPGIGGLIMFILSLMPTGQFNNV